MYIFSFFSAAWSKKRYCLGVEVALPYQVIKNLKMDHLGLYRRYMTYPTPCRNVFTECDKKQRGHAGYWTSEYKYPIEQ